VTHTAHEQAPGTSKTLIPGVRRTVLPNGLRIITEEMPGVRSAAIGVYAAVGSRDQTLKVFSRDTRGFEHCQADNRQGGIDYIADWLSDRML